MTSEVFSESSALTWTILSGVLMVLAFFYCGALLLVYIGLFHLNEGRNLQEYSVSVVIAARNEAAGIDDCLKGVQAIMKSEILEPINLGSSELVTINQLIDIVEGIAGIQVKRNYDLTKPQGVNGRNSDNTKIRQYLGWEPSIPLRIGLEKTYTWIYDEMVKTSC